MGIPAAVKTSPAASVERFFETPLLPSADAGRTGPSAPPTCKNGALEFTVFNSYKESSEKRGAFTLTWTDGETDDRFAAEPTAASPKEVMVAPICPSKIAAPLGAVQVLNSEDGEPFSPADLALLCTVAEQLGQVLHRQAAVTKDQAQVLKQGRLAREEEDALRKRHDSGPKPKKKGDGDKEK